LALSKGFPPEITDGFSGAEIEHAANEAGLLALRGIHFPLVTTTSSLSLRFKFCEYG